MHGIHDVRLKSEAHAEFREYLDVACLLVTETKIVSHHYDSRMQLPDYDLRHKLLGRKSGDLGGKRQHDDVLHALFANERYAFLDSSKQPRRALWSNDACRMRIESQYRRLQVVF